MAARKAIPPDTQDDLFLQSRRRCCLCFWLEGIDEVVAGQIAHLDQDSSNADFDNLAFLCLKHHDQFDGNTSQSKGLKESEVRKWRDELYKEMEYRFRSLRSRKLELSIVKFDQVNQWVDFKLEFRLRNTGEATADNITVSIRLAENARAESPRHSQRDPMPIMVAGRAVMAPGLINPVLNLPEMFGFYEAREDFFEPNGRVASIAPLHRSKSGLLREHSVEFTGLGFRLEDFQEGTELELQYRIDAEDMAPQIGTLTTTIPKGLEWMLYQLEELGLPEDTTLEKLEQMYKEKKKNKES